MSIIKTSFLKSLARNHYKYNTIKKSINFLNESKEKLARSKEYDIFVSHSYYDAELVFGITKFFKDLGYKAFVDWIDDSYLDRENVSIETVKVIRKRLQNCKCLIVATSKNSAKSLWIPWELGYFDGFKRKVVILPLNDSDLEKEKFYGQEYFGIYPYLSYKNEILFVENNFNYLNDFDSWLNNDNDKHTIRKMTSRG